MIHIDPVWEQKYAAGHAERYPWDCIVSFVMRNTPRDRPRSEICVLEVGFGAGSNLWFCAREGFRISGTEGSPTAVARARERLAGENLQGDLRLADFADPLPFPEGSFDLVFDRGSILCTSFPIAKKLIREINRVLKPGGKFFFNPWSSDHTSSLSGTLDADGMVDNIAAGTGVGVGRLCFYSEAMVREALDLFSIEKMEHNVATDLATDRPTVHSEWRVVARKA